MAQEWIVLPYTAPYPQPKTNQVDHEAALTAWLDVFKPDEDQGKLAAEVPEQALWEPFAWHHHANVIAAYLWGGFWSGVGWILGVGAILAVAHWVHL